MISSLLSSLRVRLILGTLLAGLSGAALAQKPAPAPDAPTRQELDGAAHRLKNFELQVERARGQPMKLSHDAQDALDRIKALKESYPGDARVEELFQRARKALVASKGSVQEVGTDVIGYRQTERKLREIFSSFAEKEWSEFRSGWEKNPNFIAKPFPPPDPEESDYQAMIGKTVILTEFSYPANQFSDCGRDFVHVGSGSRGFYFVELHGRSWPGVYEAFRRYRRGVNQDIPENVPWVLAGRITGLAYMIPEAAKEKVRQGAYGWTVQPVALYVPQRTLALADPALETGGRFSGESELEKTKSAFYTVTSIPDDVTPDRLVEIFSLAIKEKNYPLYLDCIDPNRRATPKGVSLCAYHWDWHQHRFARFYALVKIDPAKVRVVKGYDPSASVEAFFLSEEEKAKIKAHAGERVEEAEVLTRVYDETGKQYGSPKTFILQRVENGRWHIINYAQPF